MENNGKWQKFREAIFVFFILAIIAALIVYYIFKDNISLEEFRSVIDGFGIWAPLVFIILFTIGSMFIPSTPFMAAAGIFFGFKYGIIYISIGGILSAVLMFFISRKLGRHWVEGILQKDHMKKLDGYNKRLEDGGAVWDIFILRVMPMPFNVLNILMGVSRISAQEYIVGTVFGLIPSNVIVVYAGTFIAKIF